MKLKLLAIMVVVFVFNSCKEDEPSIPVVTDISDITVTDGDFVSAISFASDLEDTTFIWTNDTPSIGLESRGTGKILQFKAENYSNNIVEATITVTPKANGQTGTTKSFLITVLPSMKSYLTYKKWNCIKDEIYQDGEIEETNTDDFYQFDFNRDETFILINEEDTYPGTWSFIESETKIVQYFDMGEYYTFDIETLNSDTLIIKSVLDDSGWQIKFFLEN